MINSYYKNNEVSKEMFDEEGYFKSGDIVELIAPRKIKIIDRRKNIFKLSQGEFIAPEKLENVYIESPFVQQIFITCADLMKYQQDAVLAVIVPHFPAIEQLAIQLNIPLENHLDSDLLKQNIILQLNKLAREEKLRPFEVYFLL